MKLDFGKIAGLIAIVFGFALMSVLINWRNQPPEYTGERSTIEVTEANFDELVLNSDKPVLVDFWADYCLPCKQMEPMLESVAAEVKGRAVVARVDVQQAPKLSQKYQIQYVPTLLVFHNGEIKDRMQGGQPAERLMGSLSPLMASEAAKEEPASTSTADEATGDAQAQ